MILTESNILPVCKLSRKITLDINHRLISVRPIIKNADNEAAYTLAESYKGFSTPYCSKILSKDTTRTDVKNQELFKAIIAAAASESRDFAIQVDGCKGVLLWSSSGFTDLYKTLRWKLPRIFGWYQAMVLSKADVAGLPVYAEIAHEASMALFSRFDFVARGATHFAKATQIQIMVREAKRNDGSSKSLEIRPGRRGSEVSNSS
ncbi:hypothetical protein Unana1_03577 [Umbelopsis nana]